MDDGVDDLTADQRADLLLSRQHAAINRRQARACGLSPHQISRRVSTGRWQRREWGVFVATAAPVTSQQRAAVAVLRGPEGTVASHLTAAALWGLCGFPAEPQVTVPATASGRFREALVHRSPVDGSDRSEADGLACTSVARTLVDVAARAGSQRIERLVDRALCRELTTVEDIRAAMTRASNRPGRAGLGRLVRALAVWTPGARPGSEAEMRLLRQLVAWGLPAPERQLVILDGDGRFVARVDLGCPELKLVYEYDGVEFHGPRRQVLDAVRRRQVEALGWTVVRVRKRDLRDGGHRLRRRLMGIAAIRPLLPT